eukprot:ANDGO_07573.mRNA.1 Transmembrane protein 184 homolog DDB_G0279555
MGATVHEEAWITALCFVILAVFLSVHLILQHLRHFTQPSSQKHIVRIIMMVPIYAIDSWCALRFPSLSMYLDSIRDMYEAYVLYCFLALMIEFLGGENALVYLLSQKPPMKLPVPLGRVTPVQPGHRFLMVLKIGVLQFVLIKPLLAILTLVAEMHHSFEEGQFNPGSLYLWVTTIDNVSITVSMYCLIVFFKATHADLKAFHPLFKFLAIKAVIFATFWQGVLIAFLVYYGVITDIGTWSAEMVSQSLQDFLICVEMFIASVFHLAAFDYHEFVTEDESIAKRPVLHSVRESFGMHDFFTDVFQTFAGLRRGAERTRELREFELVSSVEDIPESPVYNAEDGEVSGSYYSAYPSGHATVAMTTSSSYDSQPIAGGNPSPSEHASSSSNRVLSRFHVGGSSSR